MNYSLNKNDMKLLLSAVDDKNLKPELNFALVTNGGICATNGRMAIKFHMPLLRTENLLVHKKLLKGFSSLMGKDDLASVEPFDDLCLKCGQVKMSLNNAAFDALFPDMDRIFEAEFESSFNLSELDDLIFELSEKKCFISNFLLQPFLLNSQGFSFHIFYNPQTEKDSGKVKIVATKTVEDENVVYYTAVLMGKVFKSQIR